MWNTPHGIRILKGAEANLLAEGILTLLADASVWNFEDYDMGIQAYDQLTPGQQIASLQAVAQALLDPKAKLLKPTTALEGTIATVFQQIEDSLQAEIETPEADTDWRIKILAVGKEAGEDDLPDPKCKDMDEWEFQIHQIASNILWDNDYETSDLTMDLPPEQAEALKELMGIPDEYIQTIPEDLDKAQIHAVVAEIRKLCARVQQLI